MRRYLDQYASLVKAVVCVFNAIISCPLFGSLKNTVLQKCDKIEIRAQVSIIHVDNLITQP